MRPKQPIGAALAGAAVTVVVASALATVGCSTRRHAVIAVPCPLFTPDDAWNSDVSAKPANATMMAKVQALLGNVNIHPDFGSTYGIPINTVPANQPPLPVTFSEFPDESDPGPYPFPAASVALIEGVIRRTAAATATC